MAIVGLVSCVSQKRAYATEARDLYESPLFVKARKYIENRCQTWYILSAKYGLVHPACVVDPYEETLNTKTRFEREQWAQRVWRDLLPHVHPGDHIVILAGERYREYLVPKLIEQGCFVDIPMKGLGIGKQLGWLSKQSPLSMREQDLDRLYCILAKLESGLGGKRKMSECNGHQHWPQSGVYLYFEPGEYRSNSNIPRIVRVGTHGVSRGSKATLWNRLRTHRGASDGTGNHRGSIFRLHVGAAIAAKDPTLARTTWGVGQLVSPDVRKEEEELERAVSKYIGTMSVLWLAIEDDASPASDRAYIERNLIGLLVGKKGPIDQPSANWLGRFSPNERIRSSGLWNLDFLDYSYSNKFLEVLDEYVLITTGKKSRPLEPIAPQDWYVDDRQGICRNQLNLFQ
jgi:Family of unknown function (DUF6884)